MTAGRLALRTARELQHSPTRPPVSSPSVAANLLFIEKGDLRPAPSDRACVGLGLSMQAVGVWGLM